MSERYLDGEALTHARVQALRALACLRLNLTGAPRGSTGSHAGLGTGSSVDFQDHRQYFPGDDPRHIDWAAYARSGHYSMTLFREEVSPRVDVVLDVSESMFFSEEKAARTLALFFFCVENARKAHASLRAYLVRGDAFSALTEDELASGIFPLVAPSPLRPPDVARLPLRAGTSRILICDLLFAGTPAAVMQALCGPKSQAVLIAPYAAEECSPQWAGNIDFVDCEGGPLQSRHVGSELLQRYRDVYARHFDLWRAEAQRLGAKLCRVAADADVASALLAEGARVGLIEAWT